MKAMTESKKNTIKKLLKDALKKENEITRIVIFGSFLNSTSPNDIDVAIFQDSDKQDLNLSLKYRKLTRKITKLIPVDIVPLKYDAQGSFLDEINSGEIIYER
jgi:uncharacterized protein